MIITRTPYRVSFFGGGTDYPVWFNNHGGAVLTTAISHYCYISGRILPPFFNHKHRIVWSEIEQIDEFTEIHHPGVREALRWMDIKYGIEIHHHGDLPARSGLGSSSSFAVGLLNMLYTLEDKEITKKGLAEAAIHLEQTLLRESVGVQDQIATAYGGFNKIEINQDGSFDVIPIKIDRKRQEELQTKILMFYTGVSRTASDIAKEKIKALPKKSAELHEMRSLVDDAIEILLSKQNLDAFGQLLNETWHLKKGLSKQISPGYVDEIYNKAIKAGALGGKLLGAGGGGFMIFYVPQEKQQSVLEALVDLLLVPFIIEDNGTEVLLKQDHSYSQTSKTRDKKFFKANLK